MAVTTTGSTAQYAGDGTTTAFPYPYQFYVASDLTVTYTKIADGSFTVWTNPSNYTVSGGAGTTGTVTAVVAPASGYTLTITRALPFTQTTTFLEGNAVASAVLQERFDRDVLLLQQVNNGLTLSLRAPTTETGTNLVIPSVFARASNLLGFDSSGNPIAYSAASFNAPAAASAAAALVSQNAAAASASSAATSATSTAADRVQTGLDRVQTGADVVTANAAASLATQEAVLAGATLTATSTTSNSIGTGTKTFTTQTNKNFQAGQPFRASSGVNTMDGTVTSYDPVAGTLVLSIATSSGSGTLTSWNLSVTGVAGASGTGSGTVTSVAAGTQSNGLTLVVSNATTTPTIAIAGSALTPVTIVASSTIAGSNLTGTNTGDQTITLTGDVTGSGTGSFAATIGANKVTNAKMATMADQTFKGNISGGVAAPSDLTATQITAALNVAVGDSGSGGTKGLVPAAGSGDAAANKFLKADMTYAVPTAAPVTTYGAVGTYGMFRAATNVNNAATIAGSNLTATSVKSSTGIWAISGSVQPSGTWRNMGATLVVASNEDTSLFVRTV